jgi:uncharacterized protein (DUF486 family)
MLRILATVGLLICSNIFMTYAWYGHLRKAAWTLPVAILLSWCIALPEYALQVPANRIGHISHGGPLSAPQLKIIQEAITFSVFLVFTLVILKERPRANDYLAMLLIFAGVAVAMLGKPAPLAGAGPAPSSSTGEAGLP